MTAHAEDTRENAGGSPCSLVHTYLVLGGIADQALGVREGL